MCRYVYINPIITGLVIYVTFTKSYIDWTRLLIEKYVYTYSETLSPDISGVQNYH